MKKSTMESIAGERELSVIERLLDAGEDPNMVDEKGFPLLWHAASRGNVVLTKLLLSRGANPNKPYGDYVSSPLMVAVEYGKNFETVKLLVDAGASLSLPHWRNKTALTVAVDYNWLRAVKLFFQKEPNLELKGLLDLATRNGKRAKEMVEYLLFQGADILESEYIFDWAYEHDYREIIDKIIEAKKKGKEGKKGIRKKMFLGISFPRINLPTRR